VSPGPNFGPLQAEMPGMPAARNIPDRSRRLRGRPSMKQSQHAHQASIEAHEEVCKRAAQFAIKKGISARAALVEITEAPGAGNTRKEKDRSPHRASYED